MRNALTVQVTSSQDKHTNLLQFIDCCKEVSQSIGCQLQVLMIDQTCLKVIQYQRQHHATGGWEYRTLDGLMEQSR